MKISNTILALWFIICMGAMAYCVHIGASTDSYKCRITNTIVGFDTTQYICKNKELDVQFVISKEDTKQRLYYGKLLKVVYREDKLIDVR